MCFDSTKHLKANTWLQNTLQASSTETLPHETDELFVVIIFIFFFKNSCGKMYTT